MKYRLIELLECPGCRGPLTLSVKELQTVAEVSSKPFPCQSVCGRTGAAVVTQESLCGACTNVEIVSGTLTCRACQDVFPIIAGVPWMQDDQSLRREATDTDPVAVYSHLWRHLTSQSDPGPNHVDAMVAALGNEIVQGNIGLDAGSGCGADTVTLARRHPDVEVISLDLSEGVYETYRRAGGLANVHVIRGSVLAIPLRSARCDFVYSFGVLHHTPDPNRGMQEVVRVLKPNGMVSLYLYEDHADNPWKSIPLKIVTAIRRLTVRLNTRVLSAFCYVLSPFVVLIFSVPAKIMRRFATTRALAEQMPFNFGTSFFSIQGDLLDRFGAPIEGRYSRERVIELLQQSGLIKVRVINLHAIAGWGVRAVKINK